MHQTDPRPVRYQHKWKAPFDDAISERLRPEIVILDVGGGRAPAVAPDARPPGTTYIGLDPDADELEAAPAGAYDRVIVQPAETLVPRLTAEVDLIVSWQVLEHVRSLDRVLHNLHSYLKPSGTVVSLFSGKWSAFGILNRVLPDWVGAPLVSRVMNRKAINRPVFPAYYDDCSHTALRSLTAYWSDTDITPFYRGADYFSFYLPLQRAYLAYENAVANRNISDLATHYLLVGTR